MAPPRKALADRMRIYYPRLLQGQGNLPSIGCCISRKSSEGRGVWVWVWVWVGVELERQHSDQMFDFHGTFNYDFHFTVYSFRIIPHWDVDNCN